MQLLLQVMLDEFKIVIEDGNTGAVAEDIYEDGFTMVKGKAWR